MKTIYNFMEKNPIIGCALSCLVILVIFASIRAYSFRHIAEHKGEQIINILHNMEDNSYVAQLESGKYIDITRAERHYIINNQYKIK